MRCRICAFTARRSHGLRRSPAATSTAIRRFSRTVSSGKISVIWNVRAMPIATRFSGEVRVTSWPWNKMRPEVGGKNPLIRLKNVVLPAPLGPMMARSSPGGTVSETESTATRLPKCRLAFSTTSRLM